MNLAISRPAPLVQNNNPAKEGLRAVLLWVAIEFGIAFLGGILALLLRIVGILPRTPQLPGQLLHIEFPLRGLALLILAVVFYRRASDEELTWGELGYRWSRGVAIAGIVSATMYLALVQWGTGPLDQFLFHSSRGQELLRMITEAGPLAAGMLLLFNGLGGPLVEEFAWRGYIQTKLTQGWGVGWGLVVTALLFTGKHMIVDFSIGRTTTLLVGALVLGLVRHRWGTTASTITHLVANFAATTLFIIMAFF